MCLHRRAVVRQRCGVWSLERSDCWRCGFPPKPTLRTVRTRRDPLRRSRLGGSGLAGGNKTPEVEKFLVESL